MSRRKELFTDEQRFDLLQAEPPKKLTRWPSTPIQAIDPIAEMERMAIEYERLIDNGTATERTVKKYNDLIDAMFEAKSRKNKRVNA